MQFVVYKTMCTPEGSQYIHETNSQTMGSTMAIHSGKALHWYFLKAYEILVAHLITDKSRETMLASRVGVNKGHFTLIITVSFYVNSGWVY